MKKLNSLSLSAKMISNLSRQKVIGAGYTQACSMGQPCEPTTATTDLGGGASCTC